MHELLVSAFTFPFCKLRNIFFLRRCQIIVQNRLHNKSDMKSYHSFFCIEKLDCKEKCENHEILNNGPQ